jgi:hypothetical protein
MPDPEAESRLAALAALLAAHPDAIVAALVCLNDVTESAQLREELRFQATHDALTGCLNRSAVLQQHARSRPTSTRGTLRPVRVP